MNTKIFVRYAPGSSGHFISLLILSLVTDVQIINPGSGHANINDINIGHNFNDQWTDEFKKYTFLDINLNNSIEWIKNNFYFFETNNPLHIVHTHCLNPTPLLLAFTNTKLINITCTHDELDQISYNWITKSCCTHNQWNLVQKQLSYIQHKFNKLTDLYANNIHKNTDLKLCTYINKFSRQYHNEFTFKISPDAFNISFNNIVTGKVKNQLDELIDFLGISVTQDRKNNAIKLIDNYVDAQVPAPWKLTIEDYQ